MNPVDTGVPVPLTDYISAVGGVVGIALAALAIWITRRQRIQAIKDAAQERQVLFELGLLNELLDAVGDAVAHDVYNLSDREWGRLAMLPLDELPFWHLMLEYDRGRMDAYLADYGLGDELDSLARIKVALILDVHREIERRVAGMPGRSATATAALMRSIEDSARRRAERRSRSSPQEGAASQDSALM